MWLVLVRAADKQLTHTHTHTHTHNTGLRHARKSLLPVAGSSVSQKERFEAALLLEALSCLRLAAAHTLCHCACAELSIRIFGIVFVISTRCVFWVVA